MLLVDCRAETSVLRLGNDWLDDLYIGLDRACIFKLMSACNVHVASFIAPLLTLPFQSILLLLARHEHAWSDLWDLMSDQDYRTA